MFAKQNLRAALSDLAERQLGVVRRSQLYGMGIDGNAVAHQIEMERWTTWGPSVILMQNTPPTAAQRRWAAVFHAGREAALCGLTALEIAGLSGFETPIVHIVVQRGHRVIPMPDLKVHESRRFSLEDRHPSRLPHQTKAARSAIDAAVWQPRLRYAACILAATVQQRLVRPGDLREELDRAGQVRHRRALMAVINDIEGGSQALSELDVLTLCRKAGLAEPDRQRWRTDPAGKRRYLDCEWRLGDGRIIVLEVDGSHHMEVLHWNADIKRQRKTVISGRTVLRCTGYEARFEQPEVADDLAAAGVPRLERPHRAA